ncbi:DNA-binding protein [Pseudomonas syringae]|uniref:DNA-binding protein n=1 Tax=Pseudomonas syringae TaxID=317 RepID=UPI0002ECF873|nr:DNA-binding protein [Pseudomonas syringae]
MTDTSLPPKSRDLVRLYAAELLDKGHEVSQTAIREMILVRNGVTASPNLVVDELKSFWADTGPLLNKRLKRPGVPVSVCMSFDAIWDRALEAAQESFETDRGLLTSEKNDALSRAQTAEQIALEEQGKTEALNGELLALRESNKLLAHQVATSQEEVLEVRRELRDLLAQREEQHSLHAQEISRHQQAHSEEIKRIKLLHDGEVERMQVAQEKLQRDLIEQAESFQATCNHLMKQTSQQRDDAKLVSDRLSRDLDQARDLIETLRVQRSTAREEASALSARLELAEKALFSSEQRLTAATTSHAAEIALLRKEIEQLNARRDGADSMV